MARIFGHRLLITRGALFGVLVAYVALAVAFILLIVGQKKQDRLAQANRRAILYICSTTTVLDDLVVAAGGQLAQNLRSGTYEKLERQGIITPSDVAIARQALRQYRLAHVKLANGSACNDILYPKD